MGYEDQLSAAKFKDERDLARQECELLHSKLEKAENDLRYLRDIETIITDCLWDHLPDGYGPETAVQMITDEGNRRIAEAGKRLMPEGYEWPRYEDGEPVHIGDAVNDHGVNFMVEAIEFSRYKVYVKDAEDGDWNTSVYAMHPLKRPQYKIPQVLAADGEPLEVGQTVWEVDTETDTPMTVIDVGRELTRCEYTWTDGKAYHPCLPPDRLTHQRPVLDAGGTPIETCQVMWRVSNGEEVMVSQIDRCNHPIVTYIGEDGLTHEITPDGLTHTKPEPPDSWERVEDDCSISERNYYAQLIGHDVGLKDDEEVHRAVSLDLVRRCKKLAGKEGDHGRVPASE